MVNKVAILTAGGFAPCLSSAIGGLIEKYTAVAPEVEIIAYEHGYQVWLLATGGYNLCHLLGYLFLDGGCRRLSVD